MLEPFSTVSIWDDFVRPDVSPLSSPWTKARSAAGTSNQIVSNSACPQNTNTNANYTAYVTNQPLSDCETFVVAGTFTEGNVTVWGRMQNFGAGSLNGYLLSISNANTFQLQRVTSESGTVLASGAAAGATAAGNMFGLRCIGGEISGWLWTPASGVWVKLGSANDSAYSSGYLGFGTGSATVVTNNAVSAFGGGYVVAQRTPNPVAGRGATW